MLPESPTQRAGYEEEASGEKEEHEYPALSLAKTKNIEELRTWAGERPIWLSWKLDGLTLVLTYDDGKLSKMVAAMGDSQGITKEEADKIRSILDDMDD